MSGNSSAGSNPANETEQDKLDRIMKKSLEEDKSLEATIQRSINNGLVVNEHEKWKGVIPPNNNHRPAVRPVQPLGDLLLSIDGSVRPVGYMPGSYPPLQKRTRIIDFSSDMDLIGRFSSPELVKMINELRQENTEIRKIRDMYEEKERVRKFKKDSTELELESLDRKREETEKHLDHLLYEIKKYENQLVATASDLHKAKAEFAKTKEEEHTSFSGPQYMRDGEVWGTVTFDTVNDRPSPGLPNFPPKFVKIGKRLEDLTRYPLNEKLFLANPSQEHIDAFCRDYDNIVISSGVFVPEDITHIATFERLLVNGKNTAVCKLTVSLRSRFTEDTLVLKNPKNLVITNLRSGSTMVEVTGISESFLVENSTFRALKMHSEVPGMVNYCGFNERLDISLSNREDVRFGEKLTVTNCRSIGRSAQMNITSLARAHVSLSRLEEFVEVQVVNYRSGVDASELQNVDIVVIRTFDDCVTVKDVDKCDTLMLECGGDYGDVAIDNTTECKVLKVYGTYRSVHLKDLDFRSGVNVKCPTADVTLRGSFTMDKDKVTIYASEVNDKRSKGEDKDKEEEDEDKEEEEEDEDKEEEKKELDYSTDFNL